MPWPEPRPAGPPGVLTRVTLPAVCRVALPIPAREPYRYRIPPALADRIVPGSRVVVPVRSREMVGVVTGTDDGSGEDLKSVCLAPDPTPLIPAPLITLARWVAAYYAAPLGPTIRAMLPTALWGESKVVVRLRDAAAAGGGVGRSVVEVLEARDGAASTKTIARQLGRPVWDAVQRLERAGAVELATVAPRTGVAPVTEIVVELTRRLPSLSERREVFGRATRQREAYEVIDELGGAVDARRLTREFGFSRGVLRGLVERGLAAERRREKMRDPFASTESAPPAHPTEDQQRAIDAIEAMAAGSAATLFGVTGSGKTLVYLRAIGDAVRAGRGAIILVPEIALTPQTIARVRGVFGDSVAVLHSGLSDGERVDAWHALASGRRRVAVGARSAVFAPVLDLAAIVVDEEHDGSYKNNESPRYHARDVALRRARIEGARVILGSATPSLESWAARDRIPIVALPSRATAQPLPPVELIDLRTTPRVEGSGAVPWSVTLDEAVDARLTREEQVILLLNRRGFAHFLQCMDCGQVPACASCSIALTVHATPARLRCHYCGFERRVPAGCEQCGGETQRTRGVGTQSLERWLGQRYPRARLARMDADTTATKWSHTRMLQDVARGEVDILFGTQMIAKGLDFPGVTLVGVVHADTGLHLPDFRAAERTFQLIAQVAGRAGRGPRGGTVLVQTRAPHHYALQTAAAHDFEGFAAREVEERREPPYPPHRWLVNIVVSGEEEAAVANGGARVGDWLRGLVKTQRLEIDVLGPAPAPIARIKRRWRWHLVLRAADRAVLGKVIRFASQRGPYGRGGPIRIVYDRDPVSLL